MINEDFRTANSLAGVGMWIFLPVAARSPIGAGLSRLLRGERLLILLASLALLAAFRMLAGIVISPSNSRAFSAGTTVSKVFFVRLR